MKKNILYIETASGMGGSTNSLYYTVVNIDKERYNPVIISFNTNEIIDKLTDHGYFCYIINDIIYSSTNIILLKIIYKISSLIFRVVPFLNPYTGYLIHWKTIRIINKICIKHNIDIILLNNKIYRDFFCTYFKRSNIKLISHNRSHGAALFNKYNSDIANIKIDKFIAVSESIKKDLLKNDIDEVKIEVIYNAIPELKIDNAFNIREAWGISNDVNNIVGIVGRLSPIKGHRILFDSFKLLLNELPETVLLVIGEGPLEEELVEYTKNIGIAKNVIFTGHRKDVLNIVANLDLFVLPSQNEGLPRTVLESMALKTAVIGSNRGGIPEVVINGETGIVVRYGDTAQLAESMELLLVNVALKEKYIENAFLMIKNKFGIQGYIKQIEDVYNNE